MTDMTVTAVDWSAVKDKHRSVWASGDYGKVARDLLPTLGTSIVAAGQVKAGDRVLDIAAGTGNASIPAAQRGARVTASDLSPELCEEGRAASLAAGVDIAWDVADAENLPYSDGSIDTVLSALGIMFAPRHGVAAAEMLRLVKPGGRIALLNWTPGGFIGQVFAALKPFAPAPPAGASPAPLWGDPDYVVDLLGDSVEQAVWSRGHLAVTAYASEDEVLDLFTSLYGPTMSVYAHVGDDDTRRKELDRALRKVIADHAEPVGDVISMAWEYLLFVGVRSGT